MEGRPLRGKSTQERRVPASFTFTDRPPPGVRAAFLHRFGVSTVAATSPRSDAARFALSGLSANRRPKPTIASSSRGSSMRYSSMITAAAVLCIARLVAGCATTPSARSVRGGGTSQSSCPAPGPQPSGLKTVRALTTVQWHKAVPALIKESPEPNGVWEDGAREYCGKWGRLFVWSGVKGGHPVVGTFIVYPSPPPYFPDVRWTDSKTIGPVTITGADGAQKGIVRFRAVADGGIIGTVDVWTGKWTTSGSPVGE